MTCLGRLCQPVRTVWGVVPAKVTRKRIARQKAEQVAAKLKEMTTAMSSSLKCRNTLTRRANKKCNSRSLFFQDQNQDFLLRQSSVATYSAAADSFQRLLAF